MFISFLEQTKNLQQNRRVLFEYVNTHVLPWIQEYCMNM